MEAVSKRSGVRSYSRGILDEVYQRLRERVPYEDAAKPASVVGVLHRLTKVDFVTHLRFKQLGRTVMELSEGKLDYCCALELIAYTLGHSSYKSAWRAKRGDNFTNARLERSAARKREQREEATHG